MLTGRRLCFDLALHSKNEVIINEIIEGSLGKGYHKTKECYIKIGSDLV